MELLNLSQNWNFKDVKDNIEALVSQYKGTLASFSIYEHKQKIEALRQMKVQVYSFNNILYWQKDRLWEVLNGDFDILEFKIIGG